MWLDPNPPHFPSDAAVAWGEDAYGRWQAIELNGVRQVMRWILPGRFEMGSPIGEEQREDNETQHTVILRHGFWLADTACTQALWLAVMGENPARFDSDSQNPVEQVSWQDCQGFIKRANEQLPADLQLRLPTEAEWEYACRAIEGEQGKGPFTWGEGLTTEVANYDGNYPYEGSPKGEYREKTVPVLSFQPNRWGLYQMHGNVLEWCEDRYGDYPAEPEVDPTGPEEGHERVLRGGSWIGNGRLLRSAQRSASTPGRRNNDIGLRLAGG